MHAVPPEGPLHHRERDVAPDPVYDEQPRAAVEPGESRQRLTTRLILAVLAVVAIVALIVLL